MPSRLTIAGLSASVAFSALPVNGARAEVVCVVDAGGAEGLEAEALGAALRFEGRTQGHPVEVQIASTVEACGAAPKAVVFAGPGARVRLVTGSDADKIERPFELSATSPHERSTEAADAVVSILFAVPLTESTAPLFNVSAPIEAPPPPPLAAAWALLVWMTGGHDALTDAPLEGTRLGFEVAAALREGTLSGGLAASFVPERTLATTDATASLGRAEALGVGRLGFIFGVLRLQLGLGAGYEWRWLTLRSTHRLTPVEVRSGSPVFLVEPLLWAPVGDRLLLGVGAPVRGYAGGDDYTWQTETVTRAPRYAAGLSLRLGGAF
jgi:hypothetical protein